MSGLDSIISAFQTTRAVGRAALMPYFTLGYPNAGTSLEIIEEIAGAGADLIELGIPFSDPLADGPTIQRSTQAALQQGMTVATCLELVGKLRLRGVTQPLILMGYINPILAFGVGPFVAGAAEVGADGFIIPDLPPEEAAEMEDACRRHQRALIFMLAPTSTRERLAAVVERAAGFIYLVSLVGVTGARASLPPELEGFIGRVRTVTETPLAVGFGVSTPAHAREVGALADGVIVGSALLDVIERSDHPRRAAGRFVAALRAALEPQGSQPEAVNG